MCLLSTTAHRDNEKPGQTKFESQGLSLTVDELRLHDFDTQKKDAKYGP